MLRISNVLIFESHEYRTCLIFALSRITKKLDPQEKCKT